LPEKVSLRIERPQTEQRGSILSPPDIWKLLYHARVKAFVIISKNHVTFDVPFPKTGRLLVLCSIFRAGEKLNSSHHSRRQTEMDQQKIGEFLKTLL
jgi:hypothetical protein